MLALTGNNTTLTPQEIKKLPFFMPNCDIFWVWKIWNELLWGKDFKETLDTIIGLNKNAQVQWLFYAEKTQEKILSPDDICLQAFFLSYFESLLAQKEVINILPLIDAMDLTNFYDLFRNYWDKYKRSYKKSMDFSINWFIKLIQDYDWNGWHLALKEFSDINRNFTYEGEKKYYEFNYEGKHLKIELDFKNATTKLIIEDVYIQNNNKLILLSEILNENNPFENLEKLNFILPMGYRGFHFPLLNVTEIKINIQDWPQKIYSRQQAQNTKRILELSQWVQWITQKLLTPSST